MPAILKFDADEPLEIWPDFPESEISSGTRASIGHRYLDDKVNGFSAGVWEAEANLGRWMAWPVHEFMVIVEGEVVMVEEDRETVVGPGECFFIPKGRRCIWNQSGYAKKFMVIFDDLSGVPTDGSLPIMKLDPDVPLQHCPSPPAETLISPVPEQFYHPYFTDPTGQLDIGVWQTTSVHGKLIAEPHHEVMHLIEGSVTLTDDGGTSQTFHAGDTFLVPAGTPHSWKSDSIVRKFYCIFSANTVA
ncbi:MAG: hypothetical protein JWL86_6284 [Rhizobium sp.]|nr:hypothetical protein [Rhizobium sp.]